MGKILKTLHSGVIDQILPICLEKKKMILVELGANFKK